MNVFTAKILMYHQIQQLDGAGYSLTKISSLLGINRRTVKKYLAMSPQQYEEFLSTQSERRKHLLPYEKFVREKLEAYRDTSAAQMHDWLKEHHCDFPEVNPKTVYNFVHWVRSKYNLPANQHFRQYETVPELPYGQQAQVDFGECNMRTSTDRRIKVYFLCMTLSRSRYKFIWFISRAFTTELAVLGHEKAFTFFEGITEEIVYDQDKVFMVSENKGDLILTAVFRKYVQSKGFKVHFCRKADPESKGKVENVVKYVKSNFLYNRIYRNDETLNDEAIAWLHRTANALPHSFTQKVPREEWLIEKTHLKEYVPEPVQIPLMTYRVRKDNTISWKGNLYTVPFGTYRGRGSTVVVKEESGQLIMMLPDDSLEELCRHTVSVEKGVKVINTDHKRDKTLRIEMLMLELANRFENPVAAKDWLAGLYQAKARYIRDQLQIIKEILDQQHLYTIANEALYFCHQNHIFSAVDFKAIIHQHLKQSEQKQHRGMHILNPLSGNHSHHYTQPEKSSIDDYQELLQNKGADQ